MTKRIANPERVCGCTGKTEQKDIMHIDYPCDAPKGDGRVSRRILHMKQTMKHYTGSDSMPDMGREVDWHSASTLALVCL